MVLESFLGFVLGRYIGGEVIVSCGYIVVLFSEESKPDFYAPSENEFGETHVLCSVVASCYSVVGGCYL